VLTIGSPLQRASVRMSTRKGKKEPEVTRKSARAMKQRLHLSLGPPSRLAPSLLATLMHGCLSTAEQVQLNAASQEDMVRPSWVCISETAKDATVGQDLGALLSQFKAQNFDDDDYE